MAGYSKLFSSITESSVWVEEDFVFRVWIAMLARSDSDGVVEGSIPGFASLCRMPVERMEEAIRRLTAPDPYSRCPDNEGRRLEAFPGGWLILNYARYREQAQAKEGSRAPYYRSYRARKRAAMFSPDGEEPGSDG